MKKVFDNSIKKIVVRHLKEEDERKWKSTSLNRKEEKERNLIKTGKY